MSSNRPQRNRKQPDKYENDTSQQAKTDLPPPPAAPSAPLHGAVSSPLSDTHSSPERPTPGKRQRADDEAYSPAATPAPKTKAKAAPKTKKQPANKGKGRGGKAAPRKSSAPKIAASDDEDEQVAAQPLPTPVSTISEPTIERYGSSTTVPVHLPPVTAPDLPSAPPQLSAVPSPIAPAPAPAPTSSIPLVGLNFKRAAPAPAPIAVAAPAPVAEPAPASAAATPKPSTPAPAPAPAPAPTPSLTLKVKLPAPSTSASTPKPAAEGKSKGKGKTSMKAEDVGPPPAKRAKSCGGVFMKKPGVGGQRPGGTPLGGREKEKEAAKEKEKEAAVKGPQASGAVDARSVLAGLFAKVRLIVSSQRRLRPELTRPAAALAGQRFLHLKRTSQAARPFLQVDRRIPVRPPLSSIFLPTLFLTHLHPGASRKKPTPTSSAPLISPFELRKQRLQERAAARTQREKEEREEGFDLLEQWVGMREFEVRFRFRFSFSFLS